MANDLAKGTAVPLVLRILSEGPQHGYGIVQAIRERSGALVVFTEGTIYPLLHTLEREGLLSAEWEGVPSGKRRKVYSVTNLGLQRLSQVTTEWRKFRTAVDAILGDGEVVSGNV
jgi:PadR family transcriptional regulator PadR